MYNIGLVGRNLNHSFSKEYFDEKFNKEFITDFNYKNYQITDINKLFKIIKENKLIGLNITFPFKEKIFKYLDFIDEHAKKIKSANVIYINNKTLQIYGYNTDWVGFYLSLDNFLKSKKKIKALVLGNGGASKAICYALNKKNILFKVVTRNPINEMISYNEANKLIKDYNLIINTTILGSGVFKKKFPAIDYNQLTKNHFIYDLNYNPTETIFLKESKKMGTKNKNGYEMLKIQADESLKIWNRKLKV